MSRYIDIELYEKDGWYLQKHYHNSYGEVIKTTPLVSIPTADVEPVKHGKWFKTGQSLVYPDKFRNYFCSECGFELDAYIRQEPNFCPNCGADMRGGEDGNID